MQYSLAFYDVDETSNVEALLLESSVAFGPISVGDVILPPSLSHIEHGLEPGIRYQVVRIEHHFGEAPESSGDYELEHNTQIYIKAVGR